MRVWPSIADEPVAPTEQLLLRAVERACVREGLGPRPTVALVEGAARLLERSRGASRCASFSADGGSVAFDLVFDGALSHELAEELHATARRFSAGEVRIEARRALRVRLFVRRDAASVLVVEDNDDLRELLAMRLRRRGCRVEECAEGAEALERLRDRPPPDAVVSDLGLPDVDGYALARHVRSDPRLRDVRLVALTGHADAETGRRARQAGFDAHLVKPIVLEELIAAIAPG